MQGAASGAVNSQTDPLLGLKGGKYLGEVPYASALKTMEQAVFHVRDGKLPMTLLLLEHSPVITLGRRADESELKLPLEEIDRRGVSIEKVSRGGLATYHGPGQLVGYPIIDLRKLKLGAKNYVARLEAFLVALLKSYGMEAFIKEQVRGVWCHGGKLAFIGLRINRGIASHGFSLNVCLDLEPFSYIIPCGESGEKMTSMSMEIGKTLSTEEVAERALSIFPEFFPCSVAPS